MEQTLGKRIAANRKRLKLTQDQLSEQLGVTAQAVSKWENDQSCPDITMLPKLAAIFGISTDALLGHETAAPIYQGEVVDENDENGIHAANDNWEFHYTVSKRGALCLAFMVLLVGGLMFAGRLLYWDVSFWSILWPTALLVYGLNELRNFSVLRLCVALFGAYYLVHNLGFWTLDINGNLIFPIIILLFGLSLLFDALRKPKKPIVTFHHNGNDNKKAYCNITEENESFDCSVRFCEESYTVSLPRVSSGDASVSFGELTVDLTQCQEIASSCNLDLSCAFGEMKLLLPKTCRVVPDTSTVFGSVEFFGQPDSNAPTTIHLDASTSFGHIQIHFV